MMVNFIATYIQKCKKNEVGLDDCLFKAFNDIRPYIAGGIQEMRIPPIEPLIINEITLNTGNFKAIFTDLQIFNGTLYKVTKVNASLKKNSFRLELVFPYLHMEGDYRVIGKIVILQLNGTGKASANLSSYLFLFNYV